MTTNLKRAYAVAAVLGGCAASALAAAATDPADSSGLQEIVVTAQRRTESIQNVPITIQAITGAQLTQLSIATFDDVLKYLPNVTLGSNGPGMGNIFMRGLSSGFAGNQSSATFASFPNVATYLDDQSLQFPSRNLDIYMVDMARVEVLEGPQGTLFGGGAEAGAIRYITNKPKIDKTEGNVDASYGITAHGDPNQSLDATINLPLIADTLAVRATIYNDRRGGYIDNVASNFTRSNNDSGNYYAGIKPGTNGLCPNGLPTTSGYCVPANNTVANNNAIAQRASNPLTYGGFRVAALYKMNDDWDALLTQSYQNMDASGEFTQYPVGSDGQKLGPWQVTAFVPAHNKDKFENTALTINGKLGPLKAVYSGGYLVRNIDQTNDYSNYTRSAYGFYYTCTGGTGGGVGAAGSPGQGVPAGGSTPTCYSPVTSWHDQVKNTHLSHEFRLSTPDDWRTRGIVGVFWEDFEIYDNMNFLYKTIPSCTPSNLSAAQAGGAPCLANVGPPPGVYASDPSVRNDNVAFGEDIRRGYKQTAVFASVDYDIIPKVLTITGGTRYYHYAEDEVGSKYTDPITCTNVPNGCYKGATNINAEHENTTFSGLKSRANLTWHITPDVMVYYTFSQGFRPGGFNRSIANKAKDANGVPQYSSPLSYSPDSLTNNEIGWKSEWLDHRLMLNGSVYRMDWKNVQFALFDPTILGNTTFVVNGPDYRIDGVELQFVAKVTDHLTVQGSSSWNSASQTSSPCLIANYPGSPNLGNCITEVKGQSFPNPFGQLNTRPAFSPPIEFNLRARYDWSVGGYNAFVMAGGNHIGSMSNEPASFVNGNTVAIPYTTWLRYDQPGYTTYDASLGVAKDNWTAQIYGTNLSNSDASVFTSSAQFIKSEVPLRPRVLGIKFGYRF
ncbi:MAG: TonB-dependent receptor [Gammaproteobacteria bacterium]|nr:TonB-dependent receptor [Gammaproteobacteria bacterium]